MTQSPVPIPYLRQEEAWTCGAASLGMVYRSFGMEVPEERIWVSLVPDSNDRSGVRTSRLAWEARTRGFSALVVQAKAPWALLMVCLRRGIRVVLDQPLTPGSPRRHFSVLVAADEDQVIVHDPQNGPSLTLTKEKLLDAWGSTHGNFLARAHVLAAITNSRPEPFSCGDCGTAIPRSWPCPRCRDPISLQPAAVLGCIAPECPSRLWERIYCPACDQSLNRLDASQPEGAAPLSMELSTMPNGDLLGKLKQSMAQYQETLTTAQAAATSPELSAMFGSFQEQLKQSTGELVESLKQLDEQHQARYQQIAERKAVAARQLEEAKKARDETLALRAAKKAAKAKPPETQANAPDPLLGEKLRHQLLEEFGTRREPKPPEPDSEIGSIWDYMKDK